jgi:hypothetical protein
LPNICAAVIALGLMRRMTCLISVSDKASARTSRAQVLPMVTSSLSGITAREPQQNPVLVFSITLTQKRVRSPVWIILYFTLSKALITTISHPLTNLCCDVPSLLHAHTQTKIRKNECDFSRSHIDVARTHTHTHTHTNTNTGTHAPRRCPLSQKKTFITTAVVIKGFRETLKINNQPPPPPGRLRFSDSAMMTGLQVVLKHQEGPLRAISFAR